MGTITVDAKVNLSMDWGNIKFNDYKMEGRKCDFQDLMIQVSEKRATTVEAEVQPLTTRIKLRNTELDKLGVALADFTSVQAQFKNDDSGSTTHGSVSAETVATVSKYLKRNMNNPPTKSYTEYYIQRIKSAIDGLNNESQTDMSRLQSLVDRRDESFSTATTMMSAISDTRSNLIRNL